jgi:hypothetical protein
VRHIVFGDAGDDLSSAWSNGAELGVALGCGPNPPPLGLSPFFLYCAHGLLEPVLAAIGKAKEAGDEALHRLLEKRESLLRVRPLTACIAGARMIRDGPDKYAYWSPAQHARADHMAIAKALLAEGANVNAKDVAGKTPLHHAVSGSCSALSRRIAVLLIEGGAGVNSQDRFASVCCPFFDLFAMGDRWRLHPLSGEHVNKQCLPYYCTLVPMSKSSTTAHWYP